MLPINARIPAEEAPDHLFGRLLGAEDRRLFELECTFCVHSVRRLPRNGASAA